MNVVSVRLSEIPSTGLAREESKAPRGAFDDLFDSILGAREPARSDDGIAAGTGERGESKRADAKPERAAPRKAREKRESDDLESVRAGGTDETPSSGAASRAEDVGGSRDASEGEPVEDEVAASREEEAAEQAALATGAAEAGEAVVRPAAGVPEWLALAQGTGGATSDGPEREGAPEAVRPAMEIDAPGPVGEGMRSAAMEVAGEVAPAIGEGQEIEAGRARELVQEIIDSLPAEAEADGAANESSDPSAELASTAESKTARDIEAAQSGARALVGPREERPAAAPSLAFERAGDVESGAVAASARGSSDANGGQARSGGEPPVALPAPARPDQTDRPTSDLLAGATTTPTGEMPAASADSAGAARAEVSAIAAALRPADSPIGVETTTRVLPAAAPDAVAIQADWLASRGGGTARIVLHPPELGEIAIRVTVRQQAVDVVMVAQTALAHSMAEDQSDRLAQAFAGRELRLEQFEVRRGDPTDSSSTGEFASSDAGARERERAQEERGGVARGGLRGARGSGQEGGELANATPRPVMPPRATGIDLRI